MPPVVAAVGAAAISYGTGATILGLTALQSALVIGAANLAIGYASMALAPKPKGQSQPVRQLSDRTILVRQPISSGKIHFGRLRVSGVQTMLESTGAGNSVLHSLVTLSINSFEAMDELWLNDEQVTLGAYDPTTGYAVGGKYAGYLKVWFGNGTPAGDADLLAAITAGVGSDIWSADHKQTGCAKLYMQFTWNADKYPSGAPNPTVVARCENGIIDPRVSGSPTYTGWTDNPFLCIARYLTLGKEWGGYGDNWSKINEASLIAAANACDEIASRKAVSVTFTASTDDTLTVADKSAALRTGTRLTVSTSGGLPGGLSAATNYFWIATGELTGKLATSLDNARAASAINITSSGTGTQTLTVNGEPRYTLNGTVDTEAEPESILRAMLSSAAGQLYRRDGQWHFEAGVWSASTRTLDQDDLVSAWRVTWFREPRDVYNGVKGTFVDPDSSWQPTDFPARSRASYLALDQGVRSWKDIDLQYTTSPSMAQRIASVDLERNRRQISTSWTCKLTALDVVAGDVVTLDWPRYGWEKTFQVGSIKPELTQDDDGQPVLNITLGLNELDANVFAWTPADDEEAFTASPRSNLPSAGTVSPPTGLTLSSGNTALFLRSDGSVWARIKVSWTQPDDAFVISGGRFIIETKGPLGGSPEPDWVPAGPPIDGDKTEAFILDCKDGESYSVRIKAINYVGAKSDWVEATHAVIGKTDPPSNVTGFSAQQNGEVVTFSWQQVPDLDLAGYEIRYMSAPFSWDDAIVLTSVTRGTLVTNTGLPPGPWTIGIKARDTSENYSTTATTFDITVINTYDIVAGAEQSPRWEGIFTNCLRHDVSGAVVPDSTALASAMTDAELWDEFNAYPVAYFSYQALEIDLGFDAQVRAYSTRAAALGPGVSSGVADPQFEIDYRVNADAYDGFEPWAVGTIVARYIKARASITTATGLAYLHQFEPVADVLERDDEGAENVSVAAGGTAITFVNRFHSLPNVQATAQASGGAARFATYESLSVTGFTARVFDAAGNDIGGSINWKAIGA